MIDVFGSLSLSRSLSLFLIFLYATIGYVDEKKKSARAYFLRQFDHLSFTCDSFDVSSSERSHDQVFLDLLADIDLFRGAMGNLNAFIRRK